MHNFFSFLKFTFGALHKSCLRTDVIVIGGARERAAQFRDFARSLVDGDDISCHNLLFLDAFNHLITQIVNRLHFRGFQRDFS